MTPQELKNSILQLAIEGKLVEQRPEEGTGEELYREIQREKDALVKAGKIKKEKPLPEIAEEEVPFDIPETWKWVRVGNIGSWSAGATPPRTNAEYYNGEIPWLKTGDLNDGYISEVPESITMLALEKTSVRLNPAGSVLMAMYGATIGKLGILNVAMTTNQACCACIPYGDLFNKYLFFFLMGMRKSFVKMGEGGAQPNISKEKIVISLMPLPPLAEQKRIVARIEELLPLVDRYEQAWNRLEDFNKRFPEDLQKSVLQLAIQGKLVEQRPEEGTGEELYRQIQREKDALIKAGKIKKEKQLPEISEDEVPFEIPETWKWVYVGEIFMHNTGKAQNASGSTEGVTRKFITTSNLYWNYFDLSHIKEMPFTEKEIERCSARKGDLLVCEGGDYGRAAIWPYEEEVCIQNHVHRLRAYKELDMKFYYYLFFLYKSQNWLKGRGVGIQGLSSEAIHKVVFPLPPLAEQKRIVAKIEELLPMCERLR